MTRWNICKNNSINILSGHRLDITEKKFELDGIDLSRIHKFVLVVLMFMLLIVIDALIKMDE